MSKKLLWFLLLATLLTGSGCGGDGKPTQVVAKVNGDEITIHQVNSVLGRQGAAPREGQEQALKRQALEQLIDQLLARQQALEKKLDRAPAVVQRIEAARNEVLARAYLDQIAGTVAKVAPEEVKQYYAEHPALFSERRVYRLEELTVAQRDAALTRQQAQKVGHLAELAAWLNSQNIRFNRTGGVRTAEQLPLGWLEEIHKLKEGETHVLEAGDRLTVITVAAARSVPVDEVTAAPRIEQFLFNRRLREAIAADLKHLREKSNIEYTGEFAGAAMMSEEEPEAFQSTSPNTQLPPVPNIEKGIRGLR
jgi:EpsD family peptidyl-prolyl cis-trans isomerase